MVAREHVCLALESRANSIAYVQTPPTVSAVIRMCSGAVIISRRLREFQLS